MTGIVDTHLHLWNPQKFRYPWLADFPTLQGTRSLAAYHREGGSALTASVFVEADAHPEDREAEANWAADLAEDPHNRIVGVIAGLQPESPSFPEAIERLAQRAIIKGIRRVLHNQADELSRQPLFRENLRRLAAFGFSFDLCVLERQLPLAIELVEACPEVRFIIDHGGIPDIAAATPANWKAQISQLAERSNVSCKISGLLLYANAERRSAVGIQEWFEHLISTFGWDRVVWGGDWPVCELAVPLADWITVTKELLAQASSSEQEKLISQNAKRIYRL